MNKDKLSIKINNNIFIIFSLIEYINKCLIANSLKDCVFNVNSFIFIINKSEVDIKNKYKSYEKVPILSINDLDSDYSSVDSYEEKDSMWNSNLFNDSDYTNEDMLHSNNNSFRNFSTNNSFRNNSNNNSFRSNNGSFRVTDDASDNSSVSEYNNHYSLSNSVIHNMISADEQIMLNLELQYDYNLFYSFVLKLISLKERKHKKYIKLKEECVYEYLKDIQEAFFDLMNE